MRVARITINFCAFFLLPFLLVPSLALNTDGVLLLSFKYSILGDPLSVLQSWNYEDKTPCSWNGVTCTEMGNPGSLDMFRVTSLVLPDNQLLGSIPIDLGYIEHLQILDLSNNFLNGSLPNSIFNNTELKVLSLSSNRISGELPEYIGTLRSLQVLNLSDNAMAGKVPENLTNLQNLTVVSLKRNHFTGTVPSGFSSVEVLDLSSNLLDGSLPLDFKGESLRYLNLSNNTITGSISPAFAKGIPENATIDLSFNNLTGAIPESVSLINQKTESFTGNVELCGKPLKNLCSIPSTLSTPPNETTTSPAIAVIPKTIDSNPSSDSSTGTPNGTQNQAQKTLKPATIVGIVVADLAGLAILALVILYVYQLKMRKHSQQNHNNPPKAEKLTEVVVVTKSESRKSKACSCLIGEETSESATSDSDHEEADRVVVNLHQNETEHKGGTLVTIDGETNLEVETLLKASAYILGASGGSIVYKAVLADGTAFAVRRIGESGLERLKDFEQQVRSVAKLRHPNLVRIRGFYWGDIEKLVIYDYVSNGSLATSSSRKVGSSPYHLPLEVRFKIARGVARGLAYIHEKKHVHGNIKPNNILLNYDMEPIITDLGIDRLLSTNSSFKASNSARNLGSQDNANSPGSSMSITSPYQAPESLKNLKPNPKWDVYAFGIILLELLAGRVLSDRELEQHWTGAGSVMEEEKNRVLRMADVAIRDDVERSEDAIVACFRLGFSCVSFLAQKRPTMKEAFHILEKIIPSTSSSC